MKSWRRFVAQEDDFGVVFLEVGGSVSLKIVN